MTDAAMLGPARYERRDNDSYDTPRWCTEALLQCWTPRGTVWEPACGAGAIVEVLRQHGHRVIASDIEPRCDANRADFLNHGSLGDGLFTIVTNPPYKTAERFVRCALEQTKRSSGAAAMLLRHEWDCAGGRSNLFKAPPFARKIVLTKRPRWIEGSTGAPRHNFAWFIWDWQHTGPAELRYAP